MPLRKTDSGIVILFRMSECEEVAFRAPLYGIGNAGEYRFESVLGNGEFCAANGELNAKLEKHGAMMLFYSKGKSGGKYNAVL